MLAITMSTLTKEYAAGLREFVLASKLEGTELASFNARSTVRLPILTSTF